MAHRGQPDVELAEKVYTECWDQFQTWASRHASETLRFDHLSILDDEDEEELDESLFQPRSQNHTVYQTERELRVCYYDPIEIDLEDELLEPTLGPSPTSPHWINTFTTEPIPKFSSFTHIRQLNYLRGDVWTHKPTGERVRIISGEDDEDDEEEADNTCGEDDEDDEEEDSGDKGKNKQEGITMEPPVEIKESLMDTIAARKAIRSRTLVNLEVDDYPTISQESMPFVPPEMKGRAPPNMRRDSMKEILLNYEGNFIDTESWRHFDVGWDNDEDIIGAETVRRLLYIHQMNEERIDRTRVIPQDIRRLYNFLRHRTYPGLDTVFPRVPPLPPLPLDEWIRKEEQATLESRIREKAFNICHKINCQAIMCPTHYAARERALTEKEAHETNEAQEADVVIRRGRGPLVPRWEKPNLSAHELFAKFKREKRTLCGENCFYSLGIPEHGDLNFDVIEPESDPDARTQADVETIWKVDPDAVPCDVAELSWDKVTCRQAYNIRNRLYSYLSEPEPDDDDPAIEERRGGHSGGQVNGGPCMNIGIMMKQWKPTVVKPSQYGNGLFLIGSAVQGDLISDYMGDICLPRTSLRRSWMAKANGRNYLFDIPNYRKISIDAGYAGNESRFANHPSNGHANCSAKYVWSGGEKHIALYATNYIWGGSELFLNYGSNFWSNENKMPEGDYGEEAPRDQGSEESSSDVEVIEGEKEGEDEDEEYSDESVDL
ncbi:unnamed protein product [Rhizoctonia solani]|uniref:SET domain-containing protein n=1 Tax=Rhizoctonia solani TaxID=456999 RepID=A0A8H3BU17_9AGAM|nr:unnamed protein product [Rhizoctonia solani]